MRIIIIIIFLCMPSLLFSENIYPVSLYVDEEYRSNPYWPRELKNILDEVNNRYRREFDISFDWQEPVWWESTNTNTSIFTILDQLVDNTSAASPGIIVGITGQTNLTGNELGVARYMSGHIVIKKTDFMIHTLDHELAHIFGAVHVEGSPFLMNARYEGGNNLSFDIWNSEIIRLHTQRNFSLAGYPISEKDAGRVVDIYQELLNFGRSDKELYINLGIVLSTIGRHDDAVRVLQEAEMYFYQESLFPGSDLEANRSYLKRAREQLGYVRYRQSAYQDAVAFLEELYREDSRNVFTGWYLGAAYLGLQDYMKAKEIFESLKTVAPQSISVLTSLGITYERLTIYSMAEESYYDVIRIAPERFEGYAYLGYLNTIQKKWDKAIAFLTQAIERSPQTGQLYESRGVSYHETGKKEEALKDYICAMTCDSSLPTAPYNAGIIYFEKGEYEKAESCFKKLTEYHDNDARGFQALGTVYLKTNDIKKSIKMYEKAVALDDTLADAYANLYHLYLQSGLDKKAQKAAQRYQKLTGKKL